MHTGGWDAKRSEVIVPSLGPKTRREIWDTLSHLLKTLHFPQKSPSLLRNGRMYDFHITAGPRWAKI